ncbi:MAG: photosynthetic complex assembly protein PuhC [Hyphomicrobiales bacterium]|nr:photosynthetic complex assembly protein PuhC [Hyphomicrobiales bacterium]
MTRENPAARPSHVATAPLIGAGALILFALIVVAAARLSVPEISSGPTGEPLQSRDLRFSDGANGAVLVHDASTGAAVDTIAPGANGFLRTSLRALVRHRKLHGVGAEPPFRLVAWADGAVWLMDPATGKRVNLRAFGDGNAKSVAYLMTANGATQ